LRLTAVHIAVKIMSEQMSDFVKSHRTTALKEENAFLMDDYCSTQTVMSNISLSNTESTIKIYQFYALSQEGV
jgi:hypothetical protein